MPRGKLAAETSTTSVELSKSSYSFPDATTHVVRNGHFGKTSHYSRYSTFMSLISIQAPGAVVMIRPHCFHPNPETAADNAFQRCGAEHNNEERAGIAAAARNEVTNAAAALEAAGVRTHVFDDHGESQTPDSVFPNNLFSTHPGGHIALYPMHCANRRRERRTDLIKMLKANYRVQDVIDYSGLEYDGVFLEGTDAMVLDHVARVAYTARSRRADPVALQRFCTHFNIEPMCFDTYDRAGHAVYHTNVMTSTERSRRSGSNRRRAR